MRYAQCVSQLAAVALAVGVLTGCGHDAVPTAESDGPTFAPAAKRGGGSNLNTENATGAFTIADGGELKVKFKQHGKKGDIWVKKAAFEVAPGAMVPTPGKKTRKSKKIEITMTVTSGDSFDDVRVAFTPSGTTFQPAGILTLELRGEKGKKDKDPTEEDLKLAAVHITADGTVTDVVLSTERRGAYKVIVTIDVPGFSVFGLPSSITSFWIWLACSPSAAPVPTAPLSFPTQILGLA